LARIQEAMRKELFEDEEHPSYHQLHLIVSFPGVPGRTLAVVRSPRLGRDLPLDVESLERNADAEILYDDVEVPNKGTVRRVVKVGGRPSLFFPVWLTPPVQVTTGRLFAPRGPDLLIRVVVHHARPYSELNE